MSEKYTSETDIDKINVISRIKKIDKKYGKVGNIETKIRDPFVPPSIEQKIRESLPKSKGFTANELAQKNDIRISAIKKLLEEMANEGLIEVVSISSRLKIYRGTQAKN